MNRKSLIAGGLVYVVAMIVSHALGLPVWAVTVLVIIAGLVALVWVGSLGLPSVFWKAASKNPDVAYDWFCQESSCWAIIDSEEHGSGRPSISRADFVGPFMFWVPRLNGRRITLYARRDQIEESQRRFLSHLRAPSRPLKENDKEIYG